MTTMYSARGYITLADMDRLETKIASMEETVKAIDTQVSGSSDLMYYGGGTVNAVPLSLTQTTIEAVRYGVNLSSGSFTYNFKAPFIEPPVVVANADTRTAQYVCSVYSVSKDAVTLKITYQSGTTTSTGEGLHIIAIGKTAA